MEGTPSAAFLYLLVYAFVLIVKAVIGTSLGLPGEKLPKLVLIQIHGANVAFIILVIIVKHAAFAISYLLFCG